MHHGTKIWEIWRSRNHLKVIVRLLETISDPLWLNGKSHYPAENRTTAQWPADLSHQFVFWIFCLTNVYESMHLFNEATGIIISIKGWTGFLTMPQVGGTWQANTNIKTSGFPGEHCLYTGVHVTNPIQYSTDSRQALRPTRQRIYSTKISGTAWPVYCL